MGNNMNPEIKRLWVDALRSGEFQQGRLRLRNGDAFCCLGVLCELAVRAGVCAVEKTEWGESIYDDCTASLPFSVMSWAELYEFSPVIPSGDLAFMNDTGMPFDKIADLIETEL